ncbi:MAG TPA: alpha/beta hydrolase [Bacteroidales bacterium]|nr:alpha/beta hydrolase [Bacteroidales bacterium]
MTDLPTNSTFFAGSRLLLVQDPEKGIEFNVLVQYPTTEAAHPVAFGPYVMEVSPDAPVAAGLHPLVLVSHGSGGSHLLYRTVTLHLARHGYIVAMVEHYGNNRNDNHLESSEENLILRPRHLKLAADAVCADPEFGGHVDAANIAVIGHSMGGFAALALAGGTARTREAKRIETIADPRVGALVLLAPAAGWFYQGLEKVTAPMLVLTAGHDPYTPPAGIRQVLEGVGDPSKVIHRTIANAGHFSFLSPFPPTLTRPDFLPSTDPPGFDREKLHAELPGVILSFLEKAMEGILSNK